MKAIVLRRPPVFLPSIHTSSCRACSRRAKCASVGHRLCDCGTEAVRYMDERCSDCEYLAYCVETRFQWCRRTDA